MFLAQECALGQTFMSPVDAPVSNFLRSMNMIFHKTGNVFGKADPGRDLTQSFVLQWVAFFRA